jgi:predicted amino acid racemase
MSDLFVDLEKLKHNINYIIDFCAEKQLELIAVVKGCFSYLPIIETFQKTGIKTFGISKTSNVVKNLPYMDHRPMMIALPSVREADIVSRCFKTSLNSEITTIQALRQAADKTDWEHEVILMVDNGDLREGVMPEDVLKTVRKILEISSEHLKFCGLGANLGCCSGTLPDKQNLYLLEELALDVEKQLGCEVRTVSVGGTVVLNWMQHNDLPSKINQIRIGEAFLLGYDTTGRKNFENLFNDVFTLRGEILEIKEKPSIPSGIQGFDAFGRAPHFHDRGIRKRALLNFGFSDTETSGLTPRLKGIAIVNSNSDYTIADITDCDEMLWVGDTLDFDVNYSAMMRAFISPYTKYILHKPT